MEFLLILRTAKRQHPEPVLTAYGQSLSHSATALQRLTTRALREKSYSYPASIGRLAACVRESAA
ncbi:hypothetical protein AA3990_1774 [Gluconobacter roseus NBRC 3990]|nr:hypothetical protein AA3990_1774 [Gluconobacter roseus NBRC 3990]